MKNVQKLNVQKPKIHRLSLKPSDSITPLLNNLFIKKQ